MALLLFSISAYTQINITGKVVDEKDDTPLPGASVYFNNTTVGTYTDQQGSFYFEAFNLFNTEVVVSCTGYEVLVYKPIAEKVKGKRIIVKLQKKVELQRNKMVLTNAVRKRWLDLFQKSFLGTSKEATKCTIENEPDIYFTQGENKTSFMAHADTPLVIINNMLGYKISFNLVEFWYNDENGQNYLLGYSRYEELGNNKKWIKHRQFCYYGSTLHFYRSLITNQLYEQGFGTFLIKQVMDSSREILLPGEQAKAAAGITMAVPITAHQILYIDSTNNFSIRIRGQLLVQYSSNPSSKDFSRRNIYIAGNLEKGFESYILFKESSIGLNNAGVLSDPASVEYSGYWINEKAANILPYNYQPG
ncbi:MAG: carboxypeptidase-like regulatory domain-containing protein [Ferruginibacter sp.]